MRYWTPPIVFLLGWHCCYAGMNPVACVVGYVLFIGGMWLAFDADSSRKDLDHDD